MMKIVEERGYWWDVGVVAQLKHRVKMFLWRGIWLPGELGIDPSIWLVACGHFLKIQYIEYIYGGPPCYTYVRKKQYKRMKPKSIVDLIDLLCAGFECMITNISYYSKWAGYLLLIFKGTNLAIYRRTKQSLLEHSKT